MERIFIVTETFQAHYASLQPIGRWVSRFAEQAGFDEGDSYAIQLAVDEACSNIIEHAYGGDGGGGLIECTLRSEIDRLTVVLRDWGRPFDPLSVPTPDLEADLETCPIGGLGLHLIYQLMDEVHFEFTDAGNVLTIVKYKAL